MKKSGANAPNFDDVLACQDCKLMLQFYNEKEQFHTHAQRHFHIIGHKNIDDGNQMIFAAAPADQLKIPDAQLLGGKGIWHCNP